MPGWTHAWRTHAWRTHAWRTHAWRTHAWSAAHARLAHAWLTHARMAHPRLSHAWLTHARMAHARMAHPRMAAGAVAVPRAAVHARRSLGTGRPLEAVEIHPRDAALLLGKHLVDRRVLRRRDGRLVARHAARGSGPRGRSARRVAFRARQPRAGPGQLPVHRRLERRDARRRPRRERAVDHLEAGRHRAEPAGQDVGGRQLDGWLGLVVAVRGRADRAGHQLHSFHVGVDLDGAGLVAARPALGQETRPAPRVTRPVAGARAVSRRLHHPLAQGARLGVELAQRGVAGRGGDGAGEHVAGLQHIPFAQERRALEPERARVVAVELERDPHLGEHLVVPAERQQRLAEDQATLHLGRVSQQAQPTDFHRLLVLRLSAELTASLNEVGLGQDRPILAWKPRSPRPPRGPDLISPQDRHSLYCRRVAASFARPGRASARHAHAPRGRAATRRRDGSTTGG